MPEVFRHRNGGGLIYGIEGAVSSDSLIDRTSEVRGKSFVSFMSEIRNQSVVIGSPGSTSSIACSRIDGSFVGDSQITLSSVSGSALNSVVVRGTYDPARLENMILSDGVTVEACRLRNFELSGPYLLHSDWDRQPRHFNLQEFGIPLHVIECRHEPGVPRAICGCVCRPMEEWIEKKELLRRLFQKRNHWRGAEVDLIHEHFRIWLRSPAL